MQDIATTSQGVSQRLLPYANQFLEILFGWNTLQPGLFDFNLIGQQNFANSYTFGSLDPVRGKLSTLLKLWDQNVPFVVSAQEDYIRAKLLACVTYLDAQHEEIPYRKYVHDTLGVKPEYIHDDEIQSEKNQLEKLIVDSGFGLSIKDLPTRPLMTSPEDIQSNFMMEQQRIVPQLLRWLGQEGTSVEYNAVFKNIDAYWTSWLATNDAGVLELQINLHEEQKWNIGRLHGLAMHELGGHALHCKMLRSGLENKMLHPLQGVTLLFAPEQYLFEGLAQTVQLFCTNISQTPATEVSQREVNLFWMCFNNALLSIADGSSAREAAQKIVDSVPSHSLVEVTKDLDQCLRSPVMRTYQYAYGHSYWTFRNMAENLSGVGRQKFAVELYTSILTPTRIRERYHAYLKIR